MGAAVRSDSIRDAKTGNPVVYKCVGAGVGGGGGKGDSFWPAGGTVNDGEEVGVVGGGGEGAH